MSVTKEVSFCTDSIATIVPEVKVEKLLISTAIREWRFPS